MYLLTFVQYRNKQPFGLCGRIYKDKYELTIIPGLSDLSNLFFSVTSFICSCWLEQTSVFHIWEYCVKKKERPSYMSIHFLTIIGWPLLTSLSENSLHIPEFPAIYQSFLITGKRKWKNNWESNVEHIPTFQFMLSYTFTDRSWLPFSENSQHTRTIMSFIFLLLNESKINIYNNLFE